MKKEKRSADKVLGGNVVAYLKIMPGIRLDGLRRSACKKDCNRQDDPLMQRLYFHFDVRNTHRILVADSTTQTSR
jgi:hypothetical protein